jgi:site-specific recombinase XerD
MSAWSDALEAFEADLRAAGSSPGTVSGYLGDLRDFAAWLERAAGQPVPPESVRAADVQAYRQHVSNTMGRSASTVNRRLQSIRKFGQFVQRVGVSDVNPAQGVPLVKRQGGAPPPRTLQAAEIERLMQVTDQGRPRCAVRNRAILQLLLQTGIRASEMVALRQHDLCLDENEGALMVRATGQRPDRRIPLNGAVRRALEEYLGDPRPAGSTFLFRGREGKPLSIRSVQQIVADLGAAAGLDVSSRMLRDTYARLLWQETGDLGLVAERLGYSRPETAVRHITPLETRGATTEVLEGRRAL